MTYGDFLDIVKKYAKSHLVTKTLLSYYLGNRYPSRKEEKTDKEPFAFFAEGSVGGQSGVGYDGTLVSDSYVNEEGYSETEKSFDGIFDGIVTELSPDIHFLKYKYLRNTVLKRGSRTDRGYYGDSSSYIILYCEVKLLYDTLEGMKII